MASEFRLGRLTIALHWFVAVGFISLCVMGIYMAQAEAWSLYEIHKSLGVLVFIVILVRALWRLIHGWPIPASSYQKFEQKLSKIVHWCLLLGTIFLPVFGMIHSGVGGHGFGIFGWQLVAENLAANPQDGVTAYSEFWASFGQFTHKWVGYSMLALIALHVIGAFKHHVIDKDKTLLRMIGK